MTRFRRIYLNISLQSCLDVTPVQFWIFILQVKWNSTLWLTVLNILEVGKKSIILHFLVGILGTYIKRCNTLKVSNRSIIKLRVNFPVPSITFLLNTASFCTYSPPWTLNLSAQWKIFIAPDKRFPINLNEFEVSNWSVQKYKSLRWWTSMDIIKFLEYHTWHVVFYLFWSH